MELNEALEILSGYCRSTCELVDNDYVFTFENRRFEDACLTLNKEYLRSLLEGLEHFTQYDETSLHNDNNYEVIVREETSFPIRRLRDDCIRFTNEEEHVTYELSPASDRYLLWLLGEMSKKLSPRTMRSGPFPGGRLERVLDEGDKVSPFDFIRLTSFRFLSLKISSDRSVTASRFSKLTHSVLFHIGYNLDIALVPQRLLEEIMRRGRISRMRRSRIEELDPPKRIYNETLVQHYLLAVSTDNPVIEYLSYYHVLEHFFETVFNEDLVEKVRENITSPGFSYKRKSDIAALIKKINKSLQIKRDSISFSESEALKLCLMKYVDVDDLIVKLNDYDEGLIEYYSEKSVPFSGGKVVDLELDDEDAIYKSLSKRIYSTRNALVHSKDGDMGKYTPFSDDRELIKEVPLMRFISEMVVVEESSI
ncbi:hypothetical protein V5T82_11720 [Magnetovibrio sp. PR-2]|uniref:hypothetical protein n=1 Tax=Magnetovibrio sp. PR-2 TaxID=3120356 RepID=UPI002FCDF3DB